MKLSVAIRSGLTGALRFRGRASRAEYWLFLPVGLLLPAAAMTVLTLAGASFGPILITGFAALLPLIAVTCRRALDSGETPEATLLPAMDLLLLILTLWIGHGVITPLLAALSDADGPTGFSIAVVYWAAMLIFTAAAFYFFVTGLVRGTALFSQMAEPSQPGPNTYGPNPFEVQQ